MRLWLWAVNLHLWTKNCRANWNPWKILSTSTRFLWRWSKCWIAWVSHLHAGSVGIVSVETALPALPMLTPSLRPATIVALDMNMVDLRAAVLPLVQYDMFSRREDKFFARLEKKPRHAYTQTTAVQSYRFPTCACGSTGREGGGHALWFVGRLASTSHAHGQCAIPKDQPPNASCLLQIYGGATLCCHQMPPGNASQNPGSSQVFWIVHAMGIAIIRVSLYFCVHLVRARFQLH